MVFGLQSNAEKAPATSSLRAVSPQFEEQTSYSPSFVSEEAPTLGRHRSDSSHKRLLSVSSDYDASKDLRHVSSTSSRIFATSGHGFWKNQMLVDRSLRTMALTTSLFALGMVILVFVWLKPFIHRSNTQSTSVHTEPDSCRTSENKLLALHLFINIAATMILGMSNTYQQLVTAPDVQDIPNILQKLGDCKVGTNSPWSINRKSKGKAFAWSSWVLLISTSLPIHLLANSFIGLSYTFPETSIIYAPTSLNLGNTTENSETYFNGSTTVTVGQFDFSCWSTFRTGEYWWENAYSPSTYTKEGYNVEDMIRQGVTDEPGTFQSQSITVTYDEQKCSSLRATATNLTQLETEYNSTSQACVNGHNVVCASNPETKIPCRISIRYQATVTLAIALLIKATYMLAWNFWMRGKHKTKCLTFGDVIAGSALNKELQVPNECLVNANDAYRKTTEHVCHKHCKSTEQSETGDEIGHCQKCKKFNKTNMSAGLEHPIVATKYKKSLLSNLGGNAVTQMVLLSFCSIAMLGVSLYVAIASSAGQREFKDQCHRDATSVNFGFNKTDYDICMKGAAENWEAVSGGWGGFNESVPLAALPANSISSETASFIIANGAQLVYSLLYLLLIYNLTLISMEHDWGKLEMTRKQIRSTLYRGRGFYQSYLLQLPKRVIFPIMIFSALMHWLLGQAISTKEWVWYISGASIIGMEPYQIAQYQVVYAAYPVWLSTILMVSMTSVCWWAFTWSREGYMPQMYGSIRVCCASTTGLNSFPREGIQWGDLGAGKRFRHAGFSEFEVDRVIPGELYCGSSREEWSSTPSLATGVDGTQRLLERRNKPLPPIENY